MLSQESCQLLEEGAQTVSRAFRLRRKVGKKWEEVVNVEILSSNSQGTLSPIMGREQADEMLGKIKEKKKKKEAMMGSFEGKGHQNMMESGQNSQNALQTICHFQEFLKPSSNLCSMCNITFDNYFEHISLSLHQQNLQNHPRNKDILKLIKNYSFSYDNNNESEESSSEDNLDAAMRRVTIEEYQKQFDCEDLNVVPVKRRRSEMQKNGHMSENGKIMSPTNAFSICGARKSEILK